MRGPGQAPCVTFHDVGLCHGTAFQGLLVVSRSARRSLLLDRFCFYHVDAPGSRVTTFASRHVIVGSSCRAIVIEAATPNATMTTVIVSSTRG